MTSQTYYIALPFKRSIEGHLVGGEARECPCAETATVAAEAFSDAYVGAVAFSRRIDPASGRCQNTHLLRSIGDVPNLGYLLGATSRAH